MHEDHIPGNAEPGEVLTHVGPDCPGVEPGSGHQDDIRGEALAKLLIGDAGDGDFPYLRQPSE